MASKDRILRQKEDTRAKILEAALAIGKEEGWQALSMRKIADMIDYTAPIIYEYFDNKEALQLEITRQGYQRLTKVMQAARDKHADPASQLEAMWLTYWNFAFAEKEMYQLMFGIEVNCCIFKNDVPESEVPATMISDAIGALMNTPTPAEEDVCRWYYTFWSVVHGLISINLVRQNVSAELNQYVLRNAIGGIIRAIQA